MDGLMQTTIPQERITRDALRDLFFINFLSGSVYDSEAAIRSAAREVGLTFPHPLFLVLIARTEHWGSAFAKGEADLRECHFILRNALENGFSGICQAANVLGEMTAIINLEALPESGIDGIAQSAGQILEILDSEFGVSATISISRPYHNLEQLPQAFQDARHVQEYIQLMGDDAPVTAYEQLTHPYLSRPPASYFDMEHQLVRCVKSKDFSGFQEILHRFIDSEFTSSRPTVDTFRFRVYGMVNMLLYLMNDVRMTVGDEIVDTLDIGPRLTSASSVAALLEEMDDILDQLIQYTAQQSATAIPAWAPQVRQYIQETYRDPNTTVASVADHFQLTPTYCSKVYREIYGIRMLEEIQRLRLAEAKRLLQGTDSIRSIAEKAGFPSTLTMSRAFKRYEAALPSSFRGQADRKTDI